MADLRDVNLGPLLITNGWLLPARLEHADARYADFRGADLRQAVFSDADATYADMRGAKTRATDSRDSILQGVKLATTIKALFDETRFDTAASG